ncbi:hypothetical protein WOLCODRAFT_154395 [Wolfiporia cocos MD-104 SS10]|uniref:Uncharacterized protein n=1 Tax=Wolfiporia cocos (strain MD-104) TaxID=742152 RepID=A0A2H3JS94_WOLCO|nr:hypothetical protein WOLCODRAFT_154395 [Wolfiporia cocos MD-104 SS10]
MPVAWEDFDPKWRSKVKEPEAFDNNKVKLKDWWIDMEQYISNLLVKQVVEAGKG